MNQTYTSDFEAIGTVWHLAFEGPPGIDGDACIAAIRARIDEFDKAYSRFRADSLVTSMSKSPGTYELPADANPLMTIYSDLYRHTRGLFTPLIGQTLVDAGYDASYSLLPKTLQQPPTLESVMSYDSPYLTLFKPALLDFGAAGKGYLVDIVLELIRTAGASSALVDAGGDIAIYSADSAPVQIGLEDPNNTSQAIGIASISNASICGSAGNRRAWDRFHHIIDPVTLSSPQDVLATWVVARTTLLADALATCLYFVDPALLQAHYTFEYAILRPDYSLERSPDFPAEFFLSPA